MFSNLTIGFLVGAGFGTWVFAKMQRQTGGQTSSSLTVAGIAGVGSMLFVAFLLNMLM